jgi:hypothetical protein
MATTPIKMVIGSSDPNFPYPYACSATPDLREALAVMEKQWPNMHIWQKIGMQIEGLVRHFEESTELCNSLKVYSPECRVMRQVDLRLWEGGPIFLKTFVHWDWDNKRCIVFIEAEQETYWEEHQVSEEEN